MLIVVSKKTVRARQQRRAIEIVKERQMAAWKKENASQEQAFIDDISQQGYIRKTMQEK